ncbi:cysteine dioxygenase type I, partial [Backusella circina FSU 941]
MAPPHAPINLVIHESMNNTHKTSSCAGDFQLSDLVQSIHSVLGDEGLDSEKIDVNQIIHLMEKYSTNAKDWSKYTLFDHSRAYTRNLIDDGNGKFNLMILAWSKGQHSPIHNHSGSHCVMKILDGELQETLFDWPKSADEADDDSTNASAADITENETASTPTNVFQGKPLDIKKDTMYHPNEVTYVHDKIGLHRITNPSPERGAVSLHLYTPPYKVCKTFEENTGRARSSGICSFYSIGGNRI